jgi:hypothetical protein
MRWERRSSNWTSFSSPWARAWDGHEVVDLAAGRLALHHAEENTDEVEHRLFSFISINWRGRLLRTYETVINLIGNTTNRGGLVVHVRLDRRRYPTGKKISKKERRELKVECEEREAGSGQRAAGSGKQRAGSGKL